MNNEIQKKKVSTLRAAQEYQPDAIMLENQRPPCSTHIVWVIILVLLIIGIVWASIAKIDKIVTADGKIVTVRPPITMKPLERSTIREVHVKVGQQVSKDDVLFVFDQTVNEQELAKLRDQRQSFEAQRDRLAAEADNYKLDDIFHGKLNPDQRQQQLIYSARKDYFQQKIRSYAETIERYRSTVTMLQMTMKKYEESKDALDRIEKMYLDLQKTKAASVKELLQVQINVISTAISIDQQKLTIVENQKTLLATEAERDAFVSNWRQELVGNLVDVERNLITLARQIPQYEMLVSNTLLRAPCDAVVHEIAPYQEGSAVREAEAMVTLIPLSNNLQAEIDIPAKDISWVRKGDMCRLKFDTYPFQQCGTLDGKIAYISQDAFTRQPQQGGDNTIEEGGAQSAASAGSMYQARLVISGSFMGNAKEAKILPGMRLRAEIKVGRRRVISYIFNPFVKALDEAIREP